MNTTALIGDTIAHFPPQFTYPGKRIRSGIAERSRFKFSNSQFQTRVRVPRRGAQQ